VFGAFYLTQATLPHLKEGVNRVNSVAPGPVWTPLIPFNFEEYDVAHFGENAPMGRPGQPD
jgi:NAD(P)-dependent dehydrogenase (short-subunit alcohol dehydrogenase family)